MELIFILVEPAVPENIGAAARAIKTMGFSNLRLVNTEAHLKDQAKWLAHGSNEILESATVYKCFEDSIADIDFIMATTAKSRSVKFDYYTPEQARYIFEQKAGTIKNAGIVFGSEESGLKNEELALCDIAITIPITEPYPSINLAQSVMILAYVFSNCRLKADVMDNNNNNYVLLKQKTSSALNMLNIKKGDNLFGRILERISTARATDINLMLSIISRFEKLISKK